MAQTIANDPKNRQIFAAQEDDITTELNDNWEKTVERENQFRTEIDEHDDKISDLETDVANHESRLSAVETDVADNLEESHYDNLVGFLAVCETASSASSGDTSLDVTSTSMTLVSGDKIEVFDPASGTTTTATVDADAPVGSTTLTVQSLPSGISSGAQLVLSRADLRENGPAVSDLDARLTTAENDIGSLESSLSSLSSDVSANASDISNLQTRVSSNEQYSNTVEGRVESLENSIQLSNTTPIRSNKHVAKIDDPNGNLDGSGTTTLPVKGHGGVIFEGQTLLIEDKNNGNHVFVEVGKNSNTTLDPGDPASHLDTGFDESSGDIELAQTYNLGSVEDEAKIYLETGSMQTSIKLLKDAAVTRVEKNDMVSELSVQLDKITAETDVFRSDNFDGAVDRSGSEATYDPNSPGTQGWAWFEDGSLVGHDSLFRGESEMTRATVTEGMTLSPGAFINDPNSNFSVTEYGFDILAIDGKSINQGRMFGIRDTDDQTIGGLTAKLQPGPQVILDATGDPSSQRPDSQFLARSTGRAEVSSAKGPVVLSANPKDGKVIFDGDRIVAKGLQKASSEAGLNNPVNNEVWMDTDNNQLKVYEPSTIPSPVATVDFGYTEIGDKKIRFFSTTDVKTGKITDYEWDFGSNQGSASGSDTVANAYGSTGTYTVTLTVTFAEGTTMSNQESVQVSGGGFDLPLLGDIRDDMDIL